MVDSRIVIATGNGRWFSQWSQLCGAAVVRDFAARDDILQEVAVAVLESYDAVRSSATFSSLGARYCSQSDPPVSAKATSRSVDL